MILEAYDCEDTLLLRVSGEPGSLVVETFEPYLPEMVKRHQTVGLMYWRVEGPDVAEQIVVKACHPDYLDHLASYLRDQGALRVVLR